MTVPTSSAIVAGLLAPYPHIAVCPWCLEYTEEYLGSHSAATVLAAVLDHHDSAHRNDRLGMGSTLF